MPPDEAPKWVEDLIQFLDAIHANTSGIESEIGRVVTELREVQDWLNLIHEDLCTQHENH